MPQIHHLLSKFCIFTLLILTTIPVKAQIIPDKTLGGETSRITPNILINGVSSDRIDGGSQRGSNLFHSFTEFNIGDGQSVYFSNPSGVINILTRVTGGNASNILGTLGVNGNANLFLINPNGIIFGRNASLDVKGSFVGTTANAVQFGKQGIFSAANPQALPLLTIDPSVLLFNQINQAAAITNQSQAPAGVDLTGANVTGLRVPNGKSLLLVGENITLDGGGLTAEGGRIELAGLTAPGTIGLNVAGNTLSLNVPNDVQLGDISLTNQALVVAYGAGGGDIAINAHNLNISNNSYIFAGMVGRLGNVKGGDININADSISLSNGGEIDNFTTATGDAGNIFISARNVISLDGSFIGSDVFPGAVGRGGNINIEAENISLSDGARIGSDTLGNGDSGNIFISARNVISLDRSVISGQVLSSAVGNGGDINIQAGNLSLTNAGGISSSSFGQGDSGNVSVNVRDALTISGAYSGIFAAFFPSAVGNGGNINIQAGNLSLADGGQINSSSFGQGNSGNVTVNVGDALTISGIQTGIAATIAPNAVGNGGDINVQAGNLSLTDNGNISSSTFGNGHAGNIEITSGSLSLSNAGQIQSLTGGIGNAGNITIIASDAVSVDGLTSSRIDSALYSIVEAGAVGNGGNINITTRSLSLTNGGELAVSAAGGSGTLPSGQGIAGDINIKADTLYLSNGGIAAQAASSNGGNINLNLSDYLFLRNSSQISTSAGTTQAGGNGGNITINTPFIVAVPNQNNDITANAFSGTGGNININAQSLFGIKASPQLSDPTNDITASSQLGVQGQIAITLPQVQPTQGIGKLPNQVIDASKQIVQNCPRSLNAKPLSKFIITGHASLPPSPLGLMVGKTSRLPLATLDEEASGNHSVQISSLPPIPATSPPAIIEAQGWIKTADGKIILVAHTPNITPSSRPTTAVCPQ